MKNKITDTSLFAELVKDRHKRELELKKLENLLEKKNDVKSSSPVEEPLPSKSTADEVDHSGNHLIEPVPMDIDDIPIPSDNKIETLIKLNEISLPNNIIESIPNTAPPPPPPVQNKLAPAIKTNNATTPTKKPDVKINKPKSVTKLPMPPGIDQTDLEAIESPPSRSPTPPLPVRSKTPPRKSIMNLPMPPGKCILVTEDQQSISV